MRKECAGERKRRNKCSKNPRTCRNKGPPNVETGNLLHLLKQGSQPPSLDFGKNSKTVGKKEKTNEKAYSNWSCCVGTWKIT